MEDVEYANLKPISAINRKASIFIEFVWQPEMRKIFELKYMPQKYRDDGSQESLV